MRYSPVVLDHVKNPRNAGELPNANGRARVRSAADGDMLQLHLRIESGVVKDARFKVFGCGAAIAAGSMLTEMIIGLAVEQAANITNEMMSEKMGGLPPEKIHCSVLVEQAIREALEDWKKNTSNT